MALILFLSSNSYSSEVIFNSDFTHIIPQKYKISNAEIQTDIDITIVKGQWSVTHILKRFEKLRDIYKTCNVGITISSIREVEWKYSGHGLFYDLNDNFEDRYFDGAQQLLSDLSLENKVNAIFIDSFDDYMPKLATAFPLVSVNDKSIALNTLWITNKVNDPEYLKKEPTSYSVFAHELGHVLLNDTHEMGIDKNLMHYKLGMLSGELTQKQCIRIQNTVKQLQTDKLTTLLKNNINHLSEVLNVGMLSEPYLVKSKIPSALRNALRNFGQTSVGNIIISDVIKSGKVLTFVEVTKQTDPDMAVAFRVGFDDMGPNTIHYTQNIELWKQLVLAGKPQKIGEEILSSTLGSLITHEIGHTEIGLSSLGYTQSLDEDYDRKED
jgi:hypothetical protein